MSRSTRGTGTHLVDPETSRQGDGAASAISPDTIDPREPVGSVEARSPWRMAARRFRKHKMAMISLVVLIMIVLLAFVGGAMWHYKYNVYYNDLSVPPSWKHPFGTDSTGYDTFSEVLRGTQRSLEIAMFVSVSSTIVGTIYGAISGYAGGVVDSIMMRIVDLFLTFPIIAVAAVLTHNIGPKANGWFWISVVLSALTWPYVGRVVRGNALAVREKEYIEAAHALGASRTRVVFRHVVPNVISVVIVIFTILVATSILAETALSFVGFGVAAPDTSLGLLVSQAQTAVETRPWLFYFPGLFIILIALTANFIGDGLRDALDPTASKGRS
jgi:peptide/nickel transport system permease protein